MTRQTPTYGAGDFKGNSKWGEIVEADDIFVNPQGYLLIDARASKRYKGIVEPLDPVAGHIPGALNLPYIENLDEEFSWKTPVNIMSRLLLIKKEQKGKKLVSYCGSGVTACHNILSFVHAGMEAPLLYPGSWSEWITDRNRPVQTITS